mmetsp:Transcript_11648/g.24371  ORF Transcript_11648/g.24371 Transcript_11648/m.24371 type:complete len:303 (+) Transcript_11648:316-1224(+)
MHSHHTLHIVEVVIRAVSPFLCVCLEPIEIHLAADLHHEHDGHEAAHGLVVVLLTAARLHLALEVEPQVHRAHHEPGVDEVDLPVRVLLGQRHEHLVAVRRRRHLEEEQRGVAPLLGGELEDAAGVLAVGEVEGGLGPHVRLEPLDGRVVDPHHRLVRVDLGALAGGEHGARVAHDGAGAVRPVHRDGVVRLRERRRDLRLQLQAGHAALMAHEMRNAALVHVVLGQQREGLRRPLRAVPVGALHTLAREGELPLLQALLQRALSERHPCRTPARLLFCGLREGVSKSWIHDFPHLGQQLFA